MEELSAERFEPHVGEAFEVQADARTLSYTLAEVERRGAAGPEGTHMTFSLVFLGAPGAPALGGVVPLSHPAFGTLHLLVTRLRPAADGRERVEAVFNRAQ